MKRINAEMAHYEHSDSYDCFIANHYNIDLSVTECGYEKCNPFHCWGPENKPGYYFHFVLSGKGKLYVEDKVFECKAGDLFYLSPEVMAYYEADSGDPWEYKWVGFIGTRAEGLLGNTVFVDDRVQKNVSREMIEPYFDNIFSSFQSERTPELSSTGHLYLFLSWLICNYSKKNFSKEEAEERRFFSILRYISLHYTSGMKVSDISKALNYDRTYIYKLFIKHLKMSPSEFVEYLRMRLACDLLAGKQYSLQDIAIRTGYDNYNWFFTVFKRTFGLTPQEFDAIVTSEHLERNDERFLRVEHMLKRYNDFIDTGKFI